MKQLLLSDQKFTGENTWHDASVKYETLPLTTN